TLCHEAAHLVLREEYPQEETMCRTLDIQYFEDLTTGKPYSIKSAVSNEVITPRLMRGSAEVERLVGMLLEQQKWYSRGQLIDFVLKDPTYRAGLSAEWVRRSISWWGGITNRLLPTRGFYLHVLVSRGSGAADEVVLRILESIE